MLEGKGFLSGTFDKDLDFELWPESDWTFRIGGG